MLAACVVLPVDVTMARVWVSPICLVVAAVVVLGFRYAIFVDGSCPLRFDGALKLAGVDPSSKRTNGLLAGLGVLVDLPAIALLAQSSPISPRYTVTFRRAII